MRLVPPTGPELNGAVCGVADEQRVLGVAVHAVHVVCVAGELLQKRPSADFAHVGDIVYVGL